MKLLIAIALLLAPLAAQTQSTVPVTSAASLPTNWCGMGGAYNGKGGGWLSYAILLSGKGQVYSFSSYDITLSATKPRTLQSSTRTGFATVLRSLGPLFLLGFGDAGAATNGSNVGGAFSGGGILVVKLGKTDWTLEGAVRYVKANATGQPGQTVYEFGVGRSF